MTRSLLHSLEDGGATTMVLLHVKTTAGKKFSVEIELTKTVGECKTALVDETEVPEAQQRLIYKGKVLKDDQTLESYGIAADDTLYFVRGSAAPRATTATQAAAAATVPSTTPATPSPATAPAAAPAANPFHFPLFTPPASGAGAPNPFGNMFGAGMGGAGMPDMSVMQQQLLQNPDMMRQMMESPIMQSIMNNPEIMRSMMQSNPAIQQLLEQNPQLNHVLNDPELLRQSMEAMRNPAAMREMMRSQDTALRNIESHPEGFNALRRMYHDVQEPLLDAAATGTRTPSTAFTMPGVAGSSSSSTTNTSEPASGVNPSSSTSATPANPWATPSTGASVANPWATPSAGAGAPGVGGATNPLDPFGAGLNAGAANPQLMAQLLQSPFMQPMLEQMASNPELFLSQMERLNPQAAAMLNANPQMRQMMMNPDFLRSMLNPQNIQAMMQMQSAMQQLQSSGLMPSLPGMNPGGAVGGAPSAGTAGAGAPAGGLDFSALLGGGGLGAFGAPAAPAAPVANPEEVYAAQLTQLVDMGFSNREQNIRALQATQGNVHAAVERLLSGTI